jgi:alpha-methylacyl-CoA racemase
MRGTLLTPMRSAGGAGWLRRALSTAARPHGPLSGIKVLEMEGLAAVPLCGQLLASFGADVVRIQSAKKEPHFGTTALGLDKRYLKLDLKADGDRSKLLSLVDEADVLLDPYRPGVLERLGLGPDVLLDRNKGLVVARLTGWGQTGQYAQMAGHDINYIAISGALSLFQRPGERPTFPVNLLGDFCGGSLPCALGIALALVERASSGKGQVVDAAMLDGAAFATTFLHRLVALGLWDDSRPGTNLLDGGAPFYDTYECSDGKFVAVGAIEPQFYAEMLSTLGLDPADPCLASQLDPRTWPEMRKRFAATFGEKPRDSWAELFRGTDACVSPILSLREAPHDPHNASRGLFDTHPSESVDGSAAGGDQGGRPAAKAASGASMWVSAAPRLSRTPAKPITASKPPPEAYTEGCTTAEQLLQQWKGGA